MSKEIKLPTLLVIADNPSLRFWIKKHLDDQFFILAAETREGALDTLSARLDFIIIDSALEECNALDLCKELSKLTKKNLVPIFLVTGRLKKSFRDKAVASGVTDFLSDQLDLDELQTRIAKGIQAASLRQKTEDLGLAIKVPKLAPNASLKKKFLLNDAALRLLADAKKEGTPTSLLLLRIDAFDQMQNGKELLSSFSAFLTQFLREKDICLPSEGGVILLLANTPVEVARKAAKNLHEKIQHHPFKLKGGESRFTVSIAVSAFEASEKGFNKMLDSAVKSLKARSQTNFIISLDQEPL